ncbi:MAG: hypothetical protein L0H79_05310 [Intrasporangium sp.]|uniref:hypothetical protein n=1 Tax=Intrasporangium sp. TaxID=1925024 RepID=UPI002649BDE9|nr:hypothetical protein [Intrasporangium sp.]MDN5795154.1 hypothetical protein [Intrasporangium sp.]
MTESHHPRDVRLAREAPLARGAVVASVSALVLGWCFLPQLLGMSLSLLSLARRERAGRRLALLALALGVGLTVIWGVVLGLLVKWWARTR